MSISLQLKSPTRRIFTFVILSFASMAIYLISQHYFSTIQEIQTLTLQNLQNMANTVALQIDGDEHETMMLMHQSKDDIKHKNADIIYYKIHTTLQNNLASANIKSPIYTFVFDTTSHTFNFGVTSSEQPYFRHQYSSPPPELVKNMEKGGKLEKYKDEFGYWLSAFAPIKNKKGKVVALLQVDEKFDTYVAHLNCITLQNILVGLLAFSIVIMFLINYLKKVLAQEEKAKKYLSEAYLEKTEINEKLQENEQQLKHYAQELEQSNQELVDFANIASHDLKAPVRGILSFVQLYEKRNKDKFDERDKEYFEFIKTNARQSLQLIEGLLNYSKVDKNIGNSIEMDVETAVKTAQNNLLSIIYERNAVIEMGALPCIEAHPLLVMQLFQNLINNGIKYNQSTQPFVYISARYTENEGYIYSVKDNGIGIAERHQQDVFAMFRRLHGAGEYEGSGIGLAFCKRIVQTYEGKMWLESELGLGSTFFFTLPKAAVVSKKAVLEMA